MTKSSLLSNKKEHIREYVEKNLMAYKLYIDDLREPESDGYIVVRSSSAAIDMMCEFGCPEFISFDHDLGGDDTAMIIIKWMIELDLDKGGEFIPKNFDYHIHSANPVGAKDMKGLLKNYLSFR